MNFQMQLMNMWKDYYDRDGLTKQKGYKPDFSVFTPMEATLNQIVNELESMNQSLNSSNPNETNSQKHERIYGTIMQKYDDLVKSHAQARKNGRIKESLTTILKNFPALLSYINKSVLPKGIKTIIFDPNISTEVKKQILEDVPTSIKISDLEPLHASSSIMDDIFDTKPVQKSQIKIPPKINLDDVFNETEPAQSQNDNYNDDDEGDALNILNDAVDPNASTINFRNNSHVIKLGQVKLEERSQSLINAYHRLERTQNVTDKIVSAYHVAVNNVLNRLSEVDKLPQGTKNIRAKRQNIDDIAGDLIRRINGVIMGNLNKGKKKAKKSPVKQKQNDDDDNNEWRTVSGAWEDDDFDGYNSYNVYDDDPYGNDEDQFINEDNEGLGKRKKLKTASKKKTKKGGAIKKKVATKKKPAVKNISWTVPRGINLW